MITDFACVGVKNTPTQDAARFKLKNKPLAIHSCYIIPLKDQSMYYIGGKNTKTDLFKPFF